MATCHVSETRAGLRDEVKARAGSGVTLRCAVNKARCGDFHSIKWYKENRRVYVYSPVVDFSKVGDKYMRSETFRPPFSNRFKRNLLTSRAPEVYL